MTSPNDVRAVSSDPAPRLHLVSKRDSTDELDLPSQAPRCGDAPVQIDSPGHFPPVGLSERAIPPDMAEVRFIDSIQKMAYPARAAHAEPVILASRSNLLSPAELHQLYAGTSVPAHRYLAGLLSVEKKSPSPWLAGVLGVDLPGLLAAWQSTSGNTEYEQLNSIGLDVRSSRLTGVVHVKQCCGYLGGPLTAGSREFVAFWVDWGTGFQYEGTTSVAVHDFGGLPATGLEYKVFLPVDVRSHAQPGSKGAKTVKVKAVLSWNVPPSVTDACAPVAWGNSLNGTILIPPGINASSGTSFNLKCAPAGFCLRAMS